MYVVICDRFGSYNLRKISDVKLEDLQSDDDCVASFEIVGKGVMTGLYPNCRFIENGVSVYTFVNCISLSMSEVLLLVTA